MKQRKSRGRKVAIGCLAAVGIIAAVCLAVLALVFVQGHSRPKGDPRYVAMGSSFAAGIGLGDRASGSPVACMRTVNGYPRQLAARLKMPLVDVSCSAATTDHILNGGQYFQPPQLSAVTKATKLVTITSGGNDIHYVGDVSSLAGRRGSSLLGWFVGHVPGVSSGDRDYSKVRDDLVRVVEQIRKRAPEARVLLVTYPAILPAEGTCPRLGLTAREASRMRLVGERLAAATGEAARQSGALLVDMNRLGTAHHACSEAPWTNGWSDPSGAPFHPTLLGARATAAAIASVLTANPVEVPKIQDSGR